MKNSKQHIIQKQYIEISFAELDDALGVQNRIAELFYERIQPQMETIFDELFEKDGITFIERLEIDCGIIPKKNWEEEWVNNTLFRLKEELRRVDIQKKGTSVEEEFFFYLQEGFLPWNGRITSNAQFEVELILDEAIIVVLQKMIAENVSIAKRIAWKFSVAFRKKIIEYFYTIQKTDFKIFDSLLEQFEKELINHQVIDQAILISLSASLSSEQKTPERLLHEILKQQQQQNNLIEQHLNITKMELEKGNDQAIYINNSGLVILHPFLSQLFEQLRFTKEGNWLSEQMQQNAVVVLGYLVTGMEEQEEFNLPFPKILCGMLPQTVITVNGSITDEIKEACDELLAATVKHWTALKTTGVASFMHTFLQRNGKLSSTDKGWLLQVERQGVDILLERLPWGFGTIKLPWMSEIIYTEW